MRTQKRVRTGGWSCLGLAVWRYADRQASDRPDRHLTNHLFKASHRHLILDLIKEMYQNLLIADSHTNQVMIFLSGHFILC